MPSKVGRLSELVTIQVRTVANSTLGAPVDTWARHTRAYAEFVVNPGSERFREERELNATERELRVRFNSQTNELTEAGGSGKFRVLWPSTSSEPWDLEDAVREDGRRRWVRLRMSRTF